jgi:molecular chaperone DnaK
MASDNRTLGRFQLADIPPAPRGIPKIEVTFDIDANGIINVSAKDQGTGKQQKIKIESGSKLNDDEIQRMKDEAKDNEKADQDRLKKVKITNDCDSMIFQAEKMVKDLDEKLTDEEKSTINSQIEDLKKSKEAGDVSDMENKMNEAAQKISEISSRIYNEAQASEGSQESGESKSSETVEDVVVEEA